MVISHQFLTRVVFFIFSIFIFYIYFLKAFIIGGATKFGWIWMVFRRDGGEGKKEDTGESGSEP